MNFSILIYFTLIVISTTLNISSGNVVKKSNFNQRIVNGIVASKIQAPWQVFIEVYSGDDTFSTNIYNGVIIAPRYVLTTASACARKTIYNEVLKIKYGGTDRLNLPYSAEINLMIFHPNWTNSNSDANLGYNLCIIGLKEPVQTSPTSDVIPIANVKPSIGAQANYTSWGQLNSNAFPTSLRLANLTLISQVDCQNRVWSQIITDNITCATADSYTRSYTTCSGDVGAPLVINGELVGILSNINEYGCSTSATYYPEIFINTVFAREWIESTIDCRSECTSTTGPSTIGSSTAGISSTTAGISSTPSKPIVTSSLPPAVRILD